VGCGKGPDETKDTEICNNGIDDDENGLSDCADPSCASDAACQAGSECAKQEDCASRPFGDYLNDPIPLCLNAMTCSTPEASIDLHFQVKRPGYVATPVGTVNTRFVKKVAVDGSPVNCARLKEIASSCKAVDADQIERTGLFNLQAYSVVKVSGQTGGTVIPINAFSTSTGADFIIWAELWSEQPGTVSKLPQGSRHNFVCIDDPADPRLAEIKPEHHWPDFEGTSTSRTITVEVPGPQDCL